MKQKFYKKELGLELKKYKYWTLYLSPKQYYLGKLRLVLDRKIVDICDLKNKELKELHKIIKESKKVLGKCFKPDLFNYATLGNCVRHHHWHIIPRYKSIRTVNKIKFKDENWNQPPWPYPIKKVNKKTMKIIQKMILKKIK